MNLEDRLRKLVPLKALPSHFTVTRCRSTMTMSWGNGEKALGYSVYSRTDTRVNWNSRLGSYDWEALDEELLGKLAAKYLAKKKEEQPQVARTSMGGVDDGGHQSRDAN